MFTMPNHGLNLLFTMDQYFGFFALKLLSLDKYYTSSFAVQKKSLVDFDDELRIGDVRYDNMSLSRTK